MKTPSNTPSFQKQSAPAAIYADWYRRTKITECTTTSTLVIGAALIYASLVSGHSILFQALKSCYLTLILCSMPKNEKSGGSGVV